MEVVRQEVVVHVRQEGVASRPGEAAHPHLVMRGPCVFCRLLVWKLVIVTSLAEMESLIHHYSMAILVTWLWGDCAPSY